MEKGLRLGSADDIQERRKKKGALPLAVFLSFNDRDVHPHCPNARNPYHKCARHCLHKIPSGNKLLEGERSGGSSSESEKMLERKEVNPSCRNASNLFHKCTEHCFEKISEKRQDAYKETGNKKGVIITEDENAVNLNCNDASNPDHSCDECSSENSPGGYHHKDAMKPKEQKPVHAADRRVNSECKNASNPYHVCAEYCFQNAPERSRPGQSPKTKILKEKKKIINNTALTGVNPQCRYASNPFHKCSDYCIKNEAEKDTSDGSPIKEKMGGHRKERKADHPMTEKTSIDSNDIEASNTRNDYTDSSNGIIIHVGTNESEPVFVKEKKEASMIELLERQPLQIDASDLFQEWAKYCSLKAEDNEVNAGKFGQRKLRTREDEDDN